MGPSICGARPVAGSGRKAGAALGAAVRQDRAASAGAHPGPETVLACPTPVVGLEGALHDPCSWGKVGRLRTPSADRRADKSALGYGQRLETVKPGVCDRVLSRADVLELLEVLHPPCAEAKPRLLFPFRFHTCG